MGKLVPERLYSLIDSSEIREVYANTRKGLEKYVSQIECRWSFPATPKGTLREPIFSLDLNHEGRVSSHYDVILMENGSKGETQSNQLKDREGARIGVNWKLPKEKRKLPILSAILESEIKIYLQDATLKNPNIDYPNSLYIRAAARMLSGLDKDPRKE